MDSTENGRSLTPETPRLRTAHVVFADIVGYSLMATDEQSRAVHQLQSFVRELPGFAEELAAGELICIPTGDGMAIVCFGEPTSPVRYACDLAVRVKLQSSFALRMGLHNGPVYCSDDINANRNVAGGGINIAQRVMDCGDAGHILLSQSVADTLLQLSHWRDAVQDLGECEVKHGVRLRIFNLSTTEFGNPSVPSRIRPADKAPKDIERAPVKTRASVLGIPGRVAAAVLAIAFVAGGAWIAASRGVFAHHIGAAESAQVRSIAILPIANSTGDPSLDYIADGTTSHIIRQLSFLPALKVISKNSVQRFVSTSDPRKTASELGVAHVLAGSIHRDASGDFNIDFELSRGTDGSVLLSRQYRSNSSNLLATQATVVVDIVQSLAMTLTRADLKKLDERPTLNKEAWDDYLRAEHLAELMDPVSLTASLALFQKAIDLDPNFALAVSEYGAAHLKLGIFYDDPRQHMPLAKQYAVRALSIDNSLSDAHAVLGLVALLYDWDYAEAQRQLLLDSGRMNQAALNNLSCSTHLLESTGKGQRAEEELHSALVADPLSATIQSELGCNAYYSRQYDRAIREYQKALLLRPNYVMSIWGLGRAYGQKKMFREAEASLKAIKLPDGSIPPPILSELGYVYGLAGRTADARQVIREMDRMGKKAFVDPFLVAVVHLSLGERNEAFARLDDALQVRSGFLVSLKSDPKWAQVQSDPRFHSILQRVGFSD